MFPNVNFPVPKIPVPKIPKVTIPIAPFQVPNFYEALERERITPSLRKQVWEKRFKNRKSAKCYCCKERMIYPDAFICGHRRADASRGRAKLENLEPICLRCNSKMGTKDLETWCEKQYPKKLKKKKTSTKNIT
ncbi:MAG TPA: HNH endonuclease, partial [Methanomicrobiales archaeon]|nr:HNH endonuclease [Methanomicrobiales archaeon]